MGLSLFEERFPVLLSGFIEAVSSPTTIAGAAGSDTGVRIDALLVATDDTSPVVVQLGIVNISEETAILATVNLPAGAGTDGVTPAVNLVALLPTPQAAVLLPTSFVLKVICVNALTAGKRLHYAFMGGRL